MNGNHSGCRERLPSHGYPSLKGKGPAASMGRDGGDGAAHEGPGPVGPPGDFVGAGIYRRSGGTTQSVQSTRAFTLVELLVTLAMIAALAGLLFPVLGAARERSRKGRCASNLRQLYGALSIYAGDHDGLIPPYRTWTGSPPRESSALTGALKPYLRSRDVWFCPNDPYAGQTTDRFTNTTGAVNHGETSYWTSVKWAAWVAGLKGTIPARREVELDSTTQLLTDNIWLQATRTATYTHSGRFNYLWGDGSVHEPVTQPRP